MRLLPLALLALAGSASAAVTFSTTTYDDNGAGFAKTLSPSGDAYVLQFASGTTLAPGEAFFLTFNSAFDATLPFGTSEYRLAFSTTGARSGAVDVNLNGALFAPGNHGSEDGSFSYGGNGAFAPSILIPFDGGFRSGEIQSSPYVINGTDGTVTLDRLTVGLAPVPEPASFAALGVGCLGLLRRRRR